MSATFPLFLITITCASCDYIVLIAVVLTNFSTYSGYLLYSYSEMHPLLENLSVFSWMDIIKSNEMCVSLLGDLGLIPEKTDDAPACPKCSGFMKVTNCKRYILGWQWLCKKHKSKENRCCGSKNPLHGTFFENNHISMMDTFGLMFGYFLKIGVNEMQDHINCWRKSRKQKQISNKSVIDFYSRFKEIILIALRKKGEFSESLKKADVGKLFKKYSKTIGVEPYFRNLVFQFLMDIKSEYPCFGNKRVHNYIDMSASTSSSSTNAYVNGKNKNDSNVSALTNVFLTSISSAAPRNENMNIESAKTTSSVPVTTSAPITSTVSENTRLPNCASVSTAEEISSARDINMDIQNAQTSNCNTVGIANNCTDNSTVFLEDAQILNNNTVASVSVAILNNTTTTLGNAQISSSDTATIENIHTSIDKTASIGAIQTSKNNTAAIGVVQTSNNNLGTVSTPLSLSTDFQDENVKEFTFGGTVFVTEESMDIETEVVIRTNE